MTAQQRADRDALVKEWLPLARGIAGEYGQHMFREDIFSAASEGLVRAAGDYVPERGPFRAFARPRIHGAIQDYLRVEDHLTRHDRHRVNVTGIENPRRPPLSLNVEDPFGVEWIDRLHDRETPDPFEATAARELAARVRLAVEQLNQQQRYVVQQRYWRDRKLKDIGASLGVTETRAWQVLQESHRRARAILGEMAP